MPILSWEIDKDEILRRVRHHATLKIGVKVYNEPTLIEDWINHHAGIVGIENLVIGDNCSTDPHVLNVYNKFGDHLTVFRFEGPHNELHWHPRFGELFLAMKNSSRYFSFVDADERLVWIEKEFWTADKSMVDKISTAADGSIIPTTWLINVFNSFDRFTLLDTEGTDKFENNLRWGKPILPVSLLGLQHGIHNVQFSQFPFSSLLGTNLFLLHYTNFPEQRIAANRNKLISRGAIDPILSIDEILQLPSQSLVDPANMRFINEMERMVRLAALQANNHAIPVGDFITLQAGGKMVFSSEQLAKRFTDFAESGPSLIGACFGQPVPEELAATSESGLLHLAMELRTQGRGYTAERLLKRGMTLYPNLLDRYGAPAFRKEYMRMLLHQGAWSEAEQFAPKPCEIGGGSWHEIMFARAYAQAGLEAPAAKWWNLVLERDPDNIEAIKILQRIVN